MNAATPAALWSIRSASKVAPDALPLRVEVHDNFSSARAVWRELEKIGVGTSYQSCALLEAWFETLGGDALPMIVVARDFQGDAVAVLPLCIRRRFGLGVARFMGGKHANYGIILARRDFAPTGGEVLRLLREAARASGRRVDLFALTNQPASWRDCLNPLLVLPSEPSPSFGHMTRIGDDASAWFKQRFSRDAQRKFRQKEQWLAAIGPVRHSLAADPDSAVAMIAVFAQQRQARAREAGHPDAGEIGPTSAFYQRAAQTLKHGDGATLEVHALHCADRIVATLIAVRGDTRLSGMALSFDSQHAIARCSPVELLLNRVMNDLPARGIAMFDLGVGEAPYKNARCEVVEPLFDLVVPVTTMGSMAARGLKLALGLKGALKRRPAIMTALQNIRRIRNRQA